MGNIIFSHSIKCGDVVYGIAKKYNFFCAWDVEKKSFLHISALPDEIMHITNLSLQLVKHDNSIYVVPFSAKALWIFELGTGKWEKIEIEYEDILGKFVRAFMYDNNLYMIGANYPAIVKCNVETKRLSYLKEPYKKIQKKMKGNISDVYFTSYAFKNSFTVYLPSVMSNDIIELNLLNNSINVCSVGDVDNSFDLIIKNGDCYWLAPRNTNRFICWDGKEIADSFQIKKEFCGKKMDYMGAYIEDNIVKFYNANHGKTVLYDMDLRSVIEINDERYCFCNVEKDKIWKQNYLSGLMIFKEKNNICQYEIFMPHNYIREMYEYYQGDIITEGRYMNINSFLDYLIN